MKFIFPALIFLIFLCVDSYSGIIITARCSCGYNSGGLKLGGGFMNMDKADMEPAYCAKCKKVALVNVNSTNCCYCDECRGGALIYTNKQLQGEKLKFDSNVMKIIKLDPEKYRKEYIKVIGLVKKTNNNSGRRTFSLFNQNGWELIAACGTDLKLPAVNELIRIDGFLISKTNSFYKDYFPRPIFAEYERRFIKKIELVPGSVKWKKIYFPALFYLCPKCGKKNMVFNETGFWD